jgi:hypothetical protein
MSLKRKEATLYVPQPVEWGKGVDEAQRVMGANYEKLMECDRKAGETGTLVGRVIRHPFADGFAVYQVTEVSARTCRIEVCRGLGDDWVLPAWGQNCTIAKDTAMQFIKREEGLRKIFKTS